MIPFERRRMYQAPQNALLGFGSICGASFGGALADTIGWRRCFLLQVPIAFAALMVGYLVVKNPDEVEFSRRILWQRIDLSGALLLVFALCLHLLGLSLGGNELPWSNVLVILSLVVEARDDAAPESSLISLITILSQGLLPHVLVSSRHEYRNSSNSKVITFGFSK
jgi:MFS family permease